MNTLPRSRAMKITDMAHSMIEISHAKSECTEDDLIGRGWNLQDINALGQEAKARMHQLKQINSA